MRLGWLGVGLLLGVLAGSGHVAAQPAPAPPPPFLDAAGQAQYARFLLTNLPRAFALSPSGRIGWYSGWPRDANLDHARAEALESCRRKGATDCALYAENLDVVWPGRVARAAPPPGPLVDTWNYAVVPDARFRWRGPQAAAGVVVWAHGKNGDADYRGEQPPPLLRPFNEAGFDVVRFDRVPNADDTDRAGGWLRDTLRMLRGRGWRRVIAAGQSRGAWNGLQVLDTAGLADVVIAVSPAAQGIGAGGIESQNLTPPNLTSQQDEVRRLVNAVPPSPATRLAFVQFADDPFIGDADGRRALVERLRPRLGGLLVLDRPSGFSGHVAGGTPGFAEQFGACLLRFSTDPAPPASC